MRIMGLPQNFYRLGFIRQSCLPRRENALYILAMAGYVHKLRFVGLSTLKFRYSQINLFREENRLFGKPGRVPNHEKRQNSTGTKHGRIFAGVRENK